jgi:glycosyltransferase involved in cell wall biosynthesis
MPKLSIVIPVYYNAENLPVLYEDLKEKLLSREGAEFELVFVDDGSGDRSYEILRSIADQDARVTLYRLSRNFGSDAAVLCGLSHSTGDCTVVKAADLQEPTELLWEMYEKWLAGDEIVLAVRDGREEGRSQEMFANLYYSLTRRVALPNMPKTGFDVFLLDRKVIEVIANMNETNTALSGLVLWSGFRTGTVRYVRRARKIGKSRWTLRKKVRLVTDTLFSFSTLPITIVSSLGVISVVGSIYWAIDAFVSRITNQTTVEGWTMLFIFALMAFGVIMVTLGLLGGYLWRTFDAARHRPPYIVSETYRRPDERKTAE